MTGFDIKTGLMIALGAFALFYLVIVVGAIRTALARGETVGGLFAGAKSPWLYLTGAVTNFFDTLGVGSFATTTAIYRKFRLVPDERIPGTLNIGHTLPTFVQAYIFTKLVPVEPLTLVLMILAAVIGSYIGSGIVVGWPRQRVQLGMGVALAVLAVLMFLGVGPDVRKYLDANYATNALVTGLDPLLNVLFPRSGYLPAGGEALSLTGNKLAIGLLGNFVLGSLMTIGIGLYGPCMVLIYLLGMTPTAAFPIMMGSCAFLMPVASYRFVKKDFFDLRAAIGLALGGVPLTLVAALLVTNFSVVGVKLLVVVVVLYTSYGLLKSAREKKLAPIEDGIAPSPVP
ncbi:MAG: permease [Phycisphaerae bacterium]|nr:permease [Gemmatimonadaceae bacterium]